MGKKIIWTRIALNQLYEVHEYIYHTSKSLIIAEKVVSQIANSSKILATSYEIHPLDTYKSSNDGSYRAYEFFHYRISYKVTFNAINILSVRHTSRYPKSY
jgi:plasmid stabilization system protein ParE